MSLQWLFGSMKAGSRVAVAMSPSNGIYGPGKPEALAVNLAALSLPRREVGGGSNDVLESGG
jgi:hypothetical protein